MIVNTQETEKPLNEVLLTPEEDKLNVFPTSEIEKLPMGVVLDKGGDLTSVIRMGQVLQDIEKDVYKERPDAQKMFRIPSEERLFRTIQNQKLWASDRKVLDALVAKYPNMCWMRCGNLKMEDATAILEDPILTDGWVGDTRVLGYAISGYAGAERLDPVLYMIRLSDVLKAYNDSIVDVGEHHVGNISLGYKGDHEEFLEWAGKSIKAFRLPKDKGGINAVKSILEEKAVS